METSLNACFTIWLCVGRGALSAWSDGQRRRESLAYPLCPWATGGRLTVSDICCYTYVTMKQKHKQRPGRPYALNDYALPDILKRLRADETVVAIADSYHVSRCAVNELLKRCGYDIITTREVVNVNDLPAGEPGLMTTTDPCRDPAG